MSDVTPPQAYDVVQTRACNLRVLLLNKVPLQTDAPHVGTPLPCMTEGVPCESVLPCDVRSAAPRSA